MLEEPAQDDALVVARALRIEGDREARKLAEQIEKACRATLKSKRIFFGFLPRTATLKAMLPERAH